MSEDGQAELHLGNGDTEEDSLADAIQTVKKDGIDISHGRLVTRPQSPGTGYRF